MNRHRQHLANALCEISEELSSVGSVEVAELVASIVESLRRGGTHDPTEVIAAALLMADEVDPPSSSPSGDAPSTRHRL